MEVHLQLFNDAYHMKVTNEQGVVLDLDASESIGGQNKGFRPMQLLLAGLAGCSSIDVINILRKGRHEVSNFSATVKGDRNPDAIPSLFTNIHIHFSLKGNLPEDKLKRAVALSLEKYCSVAKTLEPTATITSSYQILPL